MRRKISNPVIILSVLLAIATLGGWQSIANRTGRVYMFSGTSGSIGGSLLTLGTSTSGTISITGVVPGEMCDVTPTDGTDLLALGANVSCTVTANDVVTVRVFGMVALTPPAKTYNVRVIQYP